MILMNRPQRKRLYPEDAQTSVTLGEAVTFYWWCPAGPDDAKARKQDGVVISAIVNGVSMEYLRQSGLTLYEKNQKVVQERMAQI